MLKKKINGAWSDISTLKKKEDGSWGSCMIVRKKVEGAWETIWLRDLTFSSSSSYAIINPPAETSLDIPMIYYSSYTRITHEMTAIYYATAGDEIEIKYNWHITRPNSYELYTYGGCSIEGSTFTNNYYDSLSGGTNGGGSNGTFRTTATSTGQGMIKVKIELDNPDNGGNINYGFIKIGDIKIAGLQVYKSNI